MNAPLSGSSLFSVVNNRRRVEAKNFTTKGRQRTGKGFRKELQKEIFWVGHGCRSKTGIPID